MLSAGDTSETLRDLEVGEYLLREPFADIHGYSWNKDVDYGNAITLNFGGNIFASFTVDADNTEHTINLTNTYTKWEAADFNIYKYTSYSKTCMFT